MDEHRFVAADGTIDADAVTERIDELVCKAEADEADFSWPAAPPAVDRAMDYLTAGAGQVVALYAHLRTGGRTYPFSPDEFTALESAMNTWFRLYAACLGERIDPDVSLRTAAEAFVDTEDIVAVASTVTGVSPK